jgi:RecJ-like exonuclease
MTEKIQFLRQSSQQKKEDRQRLAKLKADAVERKVVPSKEHLRLDFIERSIAEVKRHLRETDNQGRKELAGRLKFLRDERKKLLA